MNNDKSKIIKEQAWEVCKDFLGEPWTKISPEEIRIVELRGGLSNSIYRCSLPEDTPTNSQVPKDVLLRIYGPMQDDPEHLVKETVTFTLMSERKLGPKLYGVFSKGRLEQFIPSHCLKSDEMRLYSSSIAREVAKIHALHVPLKKTPDLFETYAPKWFDVAQEGFQRYNGAHFMSFDEYITEIQWLTEEIAKSDSPIVFCHNDLQGGNILYREDVPQNENPNLILIDFEFASYNYREFEMAVYFIESCFDYDTPDYPHFKMNMDNFPSKKEQVEFIEVYLDQLSKEGVQLKKSREEEIECILRNLYLFLCCEQLVVSLWCVKMTSIRSDGFGYPELLKARKMLYYKFKEQHLASVSKTNHF